ncbi:MAG: SpoIIE family protein phosphatase [Bacteroidales bacterium]|nr:SpoIIE family protein phosphatase [Bacteroidales bacterium]
MLNTPIPILLFFAFAGLFGNTHEGAPVISNYKYADNRQNYVWGFDKTSKGTLLVAGKTGLLEFDSKNWRKVDVPDIAFSVKTSANGKVTFIGGRNFIGTVTYDNSGLPAYNALVHDSLQQGNFTTILETGCCVYFYSTHTVLCIDKLSGTVINTWDAAKNQFSGIFQMNSNVFLNVFNEGLFLINNNGELLPLNPDYLLNKTIVFSEYFSDNIILIGTENGDLYLFDGQSFSDFKISNSEFIKTGILSDGALIDSSRLALSTMNFGVIVVDKQTGKTLNTLNSGIGLPNDFIMGLCPDSLNGLWIAHNLGISYIDFSLPLNNFSSFRGLNSNVLTINFWNNKLYAATSAGVFVLDSLNRYAPKEVLERVPLKTNIATKSTAQISNNTGPANNNAFTETEKTDEIQKPEQVEDKKGRKSFLKRLFTRNESQEQQQENEAKAPDNPSSQNNIAIHTKQANAGFEYLRYNINKLIPAGFGFEQLAGIDKRCKRLMPFNDLLLALTDAKLYSISAKNKITEIFSSQHIFTIRKSKVFPNRLLLVTEKGIYSATLEKQKWNFEILTENNTPLGITDVLELDNNNLLVALSSEIMLLTVDDSKTKRLTINNPFLENVQFKTVNDKNYLLAGDAAYLIEYDNTAAITFEKLGEIDLVNAYTLHDENLWMRTENNKFVYFGRSPLPDKLYTFLGVFENITDIHIDNKHNIWVVDNYEQIFKVNLAGFENYQPQARVLICEIKTQSGKRLSSGFEKLKYSDNALSFEVVSPVFVGLNTVEYQYIIEGLTDVWSEWSQNNLINVPFLPPGTYTFKVRARNIYGNISDTKSFSFRVIPPFWRTPFFFLLCTIILAAGIYFWQRHKMRRHIKEKEILQQKVKERTIELELKNKAITDSIKYAERIQKGILPADELIKPCIDDFFIFYEPKNIVSGDFYWLAQKNNLTCAVAADCTGHGVPGAFLSMLGIAYLNEIVSKAPANITAAGILETLREKIIKLFSQDTYITNDGIDIALLLINISEKTIQFAGAGNPLYQVTNNNSQIDKEKIAGMDKDRTLVVYKGDKFHVGKAVRNFRNYTNYVVPFCEDDTFYIFSDGFVDQFGGTDNAKFMYGPFKNLILEISSLPLIQQKETLYHRLAQWKGNNEQTDDILIWGLKPWHTKKNS